MVEFLILGAGGAVPTPSHGPAAYWVQLDEASLLLDPGPGALVRALASPHGPDSVDAIDTVLLTHLHLDHCADLAPLLFALHSPVPTSEAELRILGPVGIAAYLDDLRGLYGDWLTPHRRRLSVEELRPGQTLALSPGTRGAPVTAGASSRPGTDPLIQVFAAHHPQERRCEDCLCYRLSDRNGHTVAFSGDTEPCAGLTEASRNADLLVVECSAPDEWAMAGHMTPQRVARLCSQAQPRRVVLSHLYPAAVAADPAAVIGRSWPGQVTMARDGMLLQVGGQK